MKPLSDSVLRTVLTSMPSRNVLDLLNSIDADIRWKRELFYKVHLRGEVETLEAIFLEGCFSQEFQFIESFFKQCLLNKTYHLLALPYFDTKNKSFNDVVQERTKDLFSPGQLRVFGEKVEQYGVTFLNNYYVLESIRENLGISHDQVLALDHTSIFPRNLTKMVEGVENLLKHYSHKRKMILLSNESIAHTEDIKRMWTQYYLDQDTAVKDILPRKPKTMKEIHDVLSIELGKRSKPNLQLNQDLYRFNNYKVDEYTIEVPLTSYDLADTSNELKHCVFSYAHDVINKECQILNLIKDGKRIYTIEVRKRANGYFIVQFRGLMNDTKMEGGAGVMLRKKILEVINPQKQKKISLEEDYTISDR